MALKRFLLFFMTAALVFGLAGCKMPASTAPAATPTTGTGNFPVPGTENMGLFETIATQTALAAGAGAGSLPGVQGNATSVPGIPQPTQASGNPAPEATQAPAPSGNTPSGETPAAPAPVPTQAPAVVVPTATPGIPATYTIQKGDYVFCLARRFNVNPSELLNINGLGVNSLLSPGQTLSIPQTGNKFPGDRTLHSHPTTYTVRAGDTISSIACYFGDVDPFLMAQINGLDAPYSLSAGQTLQVP